MVRKTIIRIFPDINYDYGSIRSFHAEFTNQNYCKMFTEL